MYKNAKLWLSIPYEIMVLQYPYAHPEPLWHTLSFLWYTLFDFGLHNPTIWNMPGIVSALLSHPDHKSYYDNDGADQLVRRVLFLK